MNSGRKKKQYFQESRDVACISNINFLIFLCSMAQLDIVMSFYIRTGISSSENS